MISKNFCLAMSNCSAQQQENVWNGCNKKSTWCLLCTVNLRHDTWNKIVQPTRVSLQIVLFHVPRYNTNSKIQQVESMKQSTVLGVLVGRASYFVKGSSDLVLTWDVSLSDDDSSKTTMAVGSLSISECSHESPKQSSWYPVVQHQYHPSCCSRKRQQTVAYLFNAVDGFT